MKRLLVLLIAVAVVFGFCCCATTEHEVTVVATTLPVYEFTTRLCDGTDIQVTQLITENISCLHDYTLQVSQMKAVEQADTVILSGAGLEAFMEEIFADKATIDASTDISLICDHHSGDEHDDHHHQEDPHIWLAPGNAKIMTKNICHGLSQLYPQYADIFDKNRVDLFADLDKLQQYGYQSLSKCKGSELLTFHDGFGYLAQAFDLKILRAIEEESGREASAAELIELCTLVNEHDLPAIFTEINGSTSAAEIISRETGAKIYQLDMAMGAGGYFAAMYHNIDTLKEALE